ncbi:MAG: endonuclease/exonuclease/phosphatase family protein, partial [Flavobacteriaceae bacterium]
YKFPNNTIEVAKGLKVMSFNVRLFNLYQWKKEADIPQKIEAFIRQEAPDILCIQEYALQEAPAFSTYKYRYIKTSNARGNHGMALFSKFPLINTGQISFASSSN